MLLVSGRQGTTPLASRPPGSFVARLVIVLAAPLRLVVSGLPVCSGVRFSFALFASPASSLRPAFASLIRSFAPGLAPLHSLIRRSLPSQPPPFRCLAPRWVVSSPARFFSCIFLFFLTGSLAGPALLRRSRVPGRHSLSQRVASSFSRFSCRSTFDLFFRRFEIIFHFSMSFLKSDWLINTFARPLP